MFYEVIGHNWEQMPETHPLELNRAVPGGRVEMFAIRDGDYPGGWFYGMVPHVTRFLNEIAQLTSTEDSTHD